MTAVEREPIPAEAGDLIAAIVGANVKSLAWTTDRLIEGLTERAERAEAELALIREKVTHLIYEVNPGPTVIERALWPSDRAVAERRADA